MACAVEIDMVAGDAGDGDGHDFDVLDVAEYLRWPISALSRTVCKTLYVTGCAFDCFSFDDGVSMICCLCLHRLFLTVTIYTSI